MTSAATPVALPARSAAWKQALLVIAVVILVRLPFLTQAVQGDDVYYLYGAMQAQLDPLHPLDTAYVFQGVQVEMRGHPHGPVNSWVLGSLLATLGEISEPAFHLAYVDFGILAALGMFMLARRFTARPLLATLLFIAAPPFIINGTSLEADLPFLAFWMVAMALFVRAVDRHSLSLLTASVIAAMLAALTAYQAVLLLPIQAAYLWQSRRGWRAAWASLLAPLAAIAAWQAWEVATSGVLPASQLAAYLDPLQAATQKLRSAMALVVHSGWIISPLLVLAAFGWPIKTSRLPWIVAAAAALGAATYDPNPLFWGSLLCGALLLTHATRQAMRRDSLEDRFLSQWIVLFFAGAAVIFFAGSARYLLPMAAPVAILAARNLRPALLNIGIIANLTLALAMAGANAQHWNETRDLAKQMIREAGPGETGPRRIWVNGEFGLRYYVEAEGGLPIRRDQVFRPGDLIITSELAGPLPLNVPRSQLRLADVSPRIPLRLISIDGGSGYSSASKGLLPFRLSRGPVDRIRAEIVLQRSAELSFLNPQDPAAAGQIVTGLYPDGWMTNRATVVVKSPAEPTPLTAGVYISPDTPARTIELYADGQRIATQTFEAPGAYTLSAPFTPTGGTVTVMLTADATYQAPGDERQLGVVVTGVGFPSDGQ